MKGQIHYAKLETSDRLKRLLMFLSDGQEHTTMDIINGANIAAVNSAVSELRRNDVPVTCRIDQHKTNRTFWYSLTELRAA